MFLADLHTSSPGAYLRYRAPGQTLVCRQDQGDLRRFLLPGMIQRDSKRGGRCYSMKKATQLDGTGGVTMEENSVCRAEYTDYHLSSITPDITLSSATSWTRQLAPKPSQVNLPR